jgi:hypothetical protein
VIIHFVQKLSGFLYMFTPVDLLVPACPTRSDLLLTKVVLLSLLMDEALVILVFMSLPPDKASPLFAWFFF